jgi:hypothetical protein
MNVIDEHETRRMRAFQQLTEAERQEAARQLASRGFVDGDVARACGVSVEMARQWLAAREAKR